MRSTGFPPIARADAKLLILGSLPGQMSLEKQEYYAKPQNSFWRIMGELSGAYPELPYKQRLECLLSQRIAVWDVCKAAVRVGSLDSAIKVNTIEYNDFARFFKAHPHIQCICFNGEKAGKMYHRGVLANLPALMQSIKTVRLPSTSPAHAGRSFDQKLSLWRDTITACLLPLTP